MFYFRYSLDYKKGDKPIYLITSTMTELIQD